MRNQRFGSCSPALHGVLLCVLHDTCQASSVTPAAACSPSHKKKALNTPVDIVIATPTSLLAQMADGNVAIGDVQFVVVDEADTMFDEGFGPDLFKVIGPLKRRGTAFATVLVSATMRAAVKALIKAEFPGMVTAQTPSLHKGISGSHHTFVPMASGGNRLDALAQVCIC